MSRPELNQRSSQRPFSGLTKRSSLKPISKSTLKRDKLPAELAKLADGIGKFIEYWGFKSIHGKIWTLLYLSKVPLSSVVISRKLRVSKTLLSFSISELLEYDVIQEAGKGIKRTVYFRANPNLTAVILNVLRKREKPLMGEIFSSFQGVQQLTQEIDSKFNLDLDRLKKVGEFISSAQEALQSLILHTSHNEELICQLLLIAEVLSEKNKN